MKATQISMMVVLAASAGTVSAQAPSYPQRALRFIVPYTAGGGTDIIARAVANQMSTSIGQQVVVDNRGGGGGIPGTALVAKSPPDGYTLLMTSGAPISVNQSLFTRIPYDPINDFTPVSLVSTYSSFLIVHPSLPVRSVKELIVFAKGRPGQVNFGSGGFGTTQHLSAELLKDMTGIHIVHVPYKGASQAIIDLMGGHVSLLFGSGSVLPHVKSGRARLLAVTSARRSAEFPDVPTVAETLPGFESVAWVGLLAPAGTPREVVNKLHAEVVKALGNAEVRNALLAQDYGVVGSKPEEFVEYIRKDHARWSTLIKKAGIRAD